MNEAGRDHWQNVYRTKSVDSVSWYQPSPDTTLKALERFGAGPYRSLIDIGAGTSSLARCLHLRGWNDLSVLDISDAALAHARKAAGEGGKQIDWIAADITRWQPPRQYDVWHDRAVFHFLTDAAQRASYKSALDTGLAADGLAILATFDNLLTLPEN